MERAFGISGLDASYRLVEKEVAAETRDEAAEAARRMGLRHVVVYERPGAKPGPAGQDGQPRGRRHPHR